MNVQSLANKKVLVTGGSGAFGRNLIKTLAATPPARLIAFSRDEMKHSALKRDFPEAAKSWLTTRIGDITRYEDLQDAMSDVDVVIHAAAMKHLPECESNVAASFEVNVVGTRNVTRAFAHSRASHLVFLSTDKAPYASTAYGAQKLLGEKLVSEVAARVSTEKKAFTLRYSNVLDSTGAVFHIFRDLLSRGKTATVNGHTMSRGFVTQHQIISTLTNCLEKARGGEIFVVQPKVIRIAALAEAMRSVLNSGSVEVMETKGFAGEKESATLLMAEEVGFAALAFSADPVCYVVDCLRRKAFDQPSQLTNSGLTLEDCPSLEGADLVQFIKQVM